MIIKSTTEPLKLFMAYAREDKKWRLALEKHLSLLKREGLIDIWSDGMIIPGENWEEQLRKELEAADLILLLISAAFINSDYCFCIEMNHAMKRHNKGEALVIPVLISATDWHTAPFAKLQVLPPDALPIAGWDDPDEALSAVARGIRHSIKVYITRNSFNSHRRVFDITKD